MPLTIANYYTYSELARTERPTIEEFRADLAKFRRNEVVYLCSVINCALQNWHGKTDREAQDQLIRESLSSQLADYVLAGMHDGENPRGLYHRQQLLLVCKEAIRVCGEKGLNPLELPFWGGLGLVLLKANDLLYKKLTHGHGADQILNVISEMIPVAEASGFHNPANKIVRSYAMLSRFLDSRDLDLPKIFESATAIPLRSFQALSYATHLKYFEFSRESYRSDPTSFLLNADWFRQITLPRRMVESFLANTSGDAVQLLDCEEQRDRGVVDFSCFRNLPLFRDGDVFFVLDVAFLAEKAETGPFWRVLNALSTPREKNLAHVLWGAAFEKYINWLIAESVDQKYNLHFPNPRFVGTLEEVCDAIILCGECAIFIEAKGSTFTADSKYGTDLVQLQAEIEDKLVKKKGVGQLASKIERVFSRKSPEAVDGVDLSHITKVFPVLVTRDDIGSALAMNMYLALRFKDVFSSKSVSKIVTPLFSLSAQDIEKICGYLKDASLADLLEARYKNDPVLKSSFWLVANPVIERIGSRQCGAFTEILREFGKMVESELFKKPESS